MPSQRFGLILRTVAATLVALALLVALVGWIVLKAGWYNVSATSQHFQPVYNFFEEGMDESVRFHARHIQTPDLSAASLRLRGAALYRAHCAQCHGAPGVAPDAIGKSMQPLPGPLLGAIDRFQSAQLYWITRYGIKLSGMPAWEFRLSDDDIWAVVGFLQQMPELTPAAYAALIAQSERIAPSALHTGAPGPAPLSISLARGQLALTQYACNSCHIIPGVTGSDVHVGRTLVGLAERRYLSGGLPNTPANLVRWIRHPQQIDPLTAMPNLGVSEADAIDMSAYLLSR